MRFLVSLFVVGRVGSVRLLVSSALFDFAASYWSFLYVSLEAALFASTEMCVPRAGAAAGLKNKQQSRPGRQRHHLGHTFPFKK